MPYLNLYENVLGGGICVGRTGPLSVKPWNDRLREPVLEDTGNRCCFIVLHADRRSSDIYQI